MPQTYPGINPEVNLDHFTQDERTIIKKFSGQWYVTNGGEEIRLGPTSTYRYFLIKPPDNLQEMFNIERELVVIFSPYQEFQPRTLDAIDKVTRRHEALRIERVCSVVISKDNLIVEKLAELLQRDPESPIVIPFSYNEILNPIDDYFFRNRFKAHFYTRDLFAFEAPLKKDLYFFGRSDLVHKIVNRHRSNENSGLFGLRKTGKTSVVFGVERALAQVDERSVFIDCQLPAVHRTRWNHTLHYIITEMLRQFKLDLPVGAKTTYTDEDAAVKFEEDLLKVFDAVGKRNMLIVLDEIENITFNISPSEHWAKGLDFVFFWQTLRSLFQKLDKVFSYMVVGTNPMCIEVPTVQGTDNPIFNHFPFEYIPGFTVQQTREMVRRLGRIMGLRFDEILYSRLTEDFGGHPFLVRHVCSVINRLSSGDRPTEINKTVYEKAKPLFHAEYGNFIQMILTVLMNYYPDEYVMLSHLALGETEQFKKCVGDYPNYVNHLLGYGIIAKHGDEYAFQIEAVKQHLVEKGRYRKMNLTKEEMLAEISERRNKLEPKLRMIVRNQLQAGLGRAAAAQEVLYVFGQLRKDEYSGNSYDELFNPNICIIYLNDLKKLIYKRWQLFRHVFPGNAGEFDHKMYIINKYRADAHAKDLTMDEMLYFRMCVSAVEKQVDEFLG